jgi:MFS transporter, MHS family, proline/betaine transporter
METISPANAAGPTSPSHLESKAASKQARKPMFAAGIGTFIEFFDYASYSYLATTIAVVFFPQDNPSLAVLQTFALFAVSFAMRPVGALFWGHFGDRIGRKTTLSLTIIGIGLATTLVGLLPGYDTIGLWAPVLLVMARLFQSFCTAGEYSGAAVMMAEYAPVDKRARFISVVPIGCALGFLAASTVSTVLYGQLDEAAMNDWGWRIPFLLAAPMTLLGIYLRAKIDETPVFVEAKSKGEITKNPAGQVFRKHWRPLVRTLAVMGINATGYYLVLGYMATYLEVQVGLSSFQASMIMTTALLVYLPFLYIGASLADRIGRKKVLLASALGFLVLSYPVFLLLGVSNFAGAMALQILLVAIFSMNDSTFPTFFSEAFPANVRYSGFALPFNIGVALFGGTAPLLAAWLISITGNSTMPAFLMMGVAAIGTTALIASRETAPHLQKTSPAPAA